MPGSDANAVPRVADRCFPLDRAEQGYRLETVMAIRFVDVFVRCRFPYVEVVVVGLGVKEVARSLRDNRDEEAGALSPCRWRVGDIEGLLMPMSNDPDNLGSVNRRVRAWLRKNA